MRIPLPLIAVVLLVGSALTGRASDALRATPRAAPGAASLLGGLTALAVQVLWMRADQAVLDRRDDQAAVLFEAISELEPQLVSSGDFIARAIGFNLAEGHSDPAVRWAFGRQGWRVLSRTIERNPGEARAYAARARFGLLRLARDPPMRDGFVRDIDRRGPIEAAVADAEEALRLRPGWLEPWQTAGLASMARGLEHLAAGRFDDAAARFSRSAVTLRHVATVWRDAADPDLAVAIERNVENAELAEALATIFSAPAADRDAQYAELRRLLPQAGLPDLPKR